MGSDGLYPRQFQNVTAQETLENWRGYNPLDPIGSNGLYPRQFYQVQAQEKWACPFILPCSGGPFPPREPLNSVGLIDNTFLLTFTLGKIPFIHGGDDGKWRGNNRLLAL